MLESLTPESLFAELLMDESDSKAFLLVEGPDEGAILHGHLASDVSLLICGGKKNVLGASSLAASRLDVPAYGLVDRDFDGLRSTSSILPMNVVSTASYDLLSDVISSVRGSLTRVMSAHCSEGVRAIEARRGAPIAQIVFEYGLTLAKMRLASLEESLPIVFKNFDVGAVVDSSFECPDWMKFVDAARKRDPNFVCTSEVAAAVADAEKAISGDERRVGGHDIVAIVVGLLNRAGGRNVSRQAIAGSLIACATRTVLQNLRCLEDLASLARSVDDVTLFDLAA